MEIRSVVNQNEWNDFLRELAPHTFLQSWQWGVFNQALGTKIFRFGIYDGQELQGIFLVLLMAAKRGRFLFVPHGPLLKRPDADALSCAVGHLRQLVVEEKADFIRVSPLLPNSPKNCELFEKLGFRPAPIHMHAELMWLLDVRPSEDELLAGMRKNTRYAIRKAIKDGVEISVSQKQEDLVHFYRLYEETTRRHNFTPFSRAYIDKEFISFTKDNSAALFLGRYQGEVRSAALVIFTSNSGFYHQGASGFGEIVPVSQLLQWEVIREVKRRGCSYYNFWGVAPLDKPHHPWAGLSYFKRGFGGFSESYIHAQDIPIRWRYWPAYLIENLRRRHRGL
ncbi:MAG: peptidoglycan bridge formation glycyltransferase FemA/FemB family protein [bacterium]|nr:peptidoglycan bridge formation glycyltransferase FemA/FemB family protein [bacterium]